MVRLLVVVAALAVVAPPLAGQQQSSTTVLYEGARLIPGDGSQSIADSVMLVENGIITRVGVRGSVNAPAGASRVDLRGKTVMPTLINAHGHPGFQRGLTYSGDNFTRETIIDDLNRALYFGVSVVQSQGIEKGDVSSQIRDDQAAGKLGGARLRIAGRGIGSPNAGPGGAAYAGIAYEVMTEREARRAVQELAERKVNLIKIWVDDRNGRAPRLPPDLFRAIIEEAHTHRLQVNAHVFYHADAVDLVNAGIDGLVHLVRDRVMDDALVAAIVQRRVYVMPNLSSTERGTHEELPQWLKDGEPLRTLMQQSVPQAVIDRIKRSYENRNPAAVERARKQYDILQRSTGKLSKAGAQVVLGSDTGIEDLLFGVTEQRELESMVSSGMTPMNVIVAATSRAAAYLKLDTVGVLAAGREADFLVLDGNPLENIRHTQRISRVYIKGVEVDRASLTASLVASRTP